MKKFLILPLLVLFFSCATQKGLTGKKTIESPCPEGGSCSVEVLQNKSLVIKADAATGMPYYETADAPGKMVVQYTYSKNRNPDYADDFYDEEVLFETDSSLSELKNGMDAGAAKLLFGVKCFCRGKAGYYRPKTGTVKLTSNLLTITLPDNIIDGQLTQKVVIRFD